MTRQEAIEQNALLIHYASSTWRGVKADKDLRRAAAAGTGAKEASVKAEKYLVDKEEIDLNNQAFGAVYNTWRTNTLAWGNKKGAARFITGARYDSFIADIEEKIRAANERADQFAAIYPRLYDEARLNLGTTWSAKDYPDPAVIRAEFSVRVWPEPLPLSPDSLNLKFLGQAQLEKLRADLAGQWAVSERAALGDLWTRLLEPVQKMAECLSTPDKIFRDTLVGNLVEVVNLIPDLNFRNDPELSALVDRVRQELTTIDAETLRRDVRVRKQVAGAAGNILAAITGAGARYIKMDPEPEPARPAADLDPEPAAVGGGGAVGGAARYASGNLF